MGSVFSLDSVRRIDHQSDAHLYEKYLRSIHFQVTGIWDLPGMKYPYPHDLTTGKRLAK